MTKDKTDEKKGHQSDCPRNNLSQREALFGMSIGFILTEKPLQEGIYVSFDATRKLLLANWH